MLNSAALTYDGAGRIRTTSALPKTFNGGTPMNSGLLCVVVAAPVSFMGGLGYDVSGALCVTTTVTGEVWNGGIRTDLSGSVYSVFGGTPDHYVAGLPFDLNGRLCLAVSVAPPTDSFSSGFDEGFS